MRAFSSNEDGLTHPEWQQPLQEALLEFDIEKLKARIEAAETMIFNRQQAIAADANHEEERQAIRDALALLRVLKRDRLAYPDWETE